MLVFGKGVTCLAKVWYLINKQEGKNDIDRQLGVSFLVDKQVRR